MLARESKSSTGGRVIFHTVAVAILLLVGPVTLSGQTPDADSIRVNDQVSLNLIGILTKERPNFPTPLPFRHRVYNKLPSSFQTLYSRFFQTPDPITVPVQYSSPGDSAARFIFKAEVPPGWVTGGNADTKVNDALKKAGIHRVRIHYSEGWYSQSETIEARIYFGDQTGAVYLDPLIGYIPKTFKELQLEFIGPWSDKLDTVEDTITVHNPVYRKIKPLTDPHALPATAEISGVSVRLHALVSKSVGVNMPRSDKDGRSAIELAKKLQFLRAAGTPDDPYNCVAAFSIDDSTTSAQQWALTDTTFFYGQSLEQLTPYMRGGPRKINSGPDNIELNLFSFQPDPGVLYQPVKVQVKLVRDKFFLPDEVQTVDVAFPTTGSVTGPVTINEFWNGPVTVYVANEAMAEIKNLSLHPGPDSIGIGLEGNSPYVKLVSAKLLSEDNSVDISPYGGLSSSSANSKEFNYDFNRTLTSQLKPVDLTNVSTISLTIASPRIIERPFEFIVQPTEATVPAVPSEF